MAMAGVVVLFITLVALGGYFLYRSLPGNGDVVVHDQSDSSVDAKAEAVESKALHIRVIGESSEVLVRVPGGDVLVDADMEQGQYVAYDQAELDVTISDPSAVEVHVNGERMDISGEEPGYSFSTAET
ncbi:RodZ domain-containing protein [Allosalinactinospora lopnorensis]|uniref:RodZ domain-containing protein n=1 Tax=Allosalinactinospora lopnorensis TaxID=1352348 RepID=UPI0009E374BE|nr:RodZ domain-containing protein [Allosalinactinospora lopnorensis]